MPFIENVFCEEEGKACLIGGKCTRCDRVYFPCTPFCVECGVDAVEPITFGRTGQLYSFTTSHMPSGHFTAPYSTGFVEFEEGLRIFAPLRIRKDQTPAIGAEVVLVIDELWREGKTGVRGYIYEMKGKAGYPAVGAENP